MFGLTPKKETAPVSNETHEVDAVHVWVVSWWSRKDMFQHSISHTTEKREFVAFTSEEQASTFADSLRAAFKLIRNAGNSTLVSVEKQ